VDPEGNLTGPGLTPDTDEFGRDDPDALERAARRREREARRKGSRPKKEKRPKREKRPRREKRRKTREEPAPEQPAPRQATPPAEPPPAKQPATAPPPRAQGRASAGRDALKARVAANRAAKPARRGNYRRRRILAMVLALVGILAAWFLVALFQPFAGDGEGDGSVLVEIPEGSDTGEIADILDEQGVISSASLFQLRLRLSGETDSIQADSYQLAEGMSYSTVIDRLTGKQPTGGAVTVTIPEGLSREQIASDVLPEGVSSDEYLELTETAPKGFDTRQYGAKSDSLEGFLFPATYDLPAENNVKALVDQQLAAFPDNISQVDLKAAKKKNLTAYDILIIASMIDKEVQVPKERPLVASVIYNRLSQGIPLGIDATTRYETGNYTEPITQADLEADTPYNTRINAGLPPTPIGNPGLAAMKAAAAPANTKFIYFVVKPGTCGEHSFTASEAEFEKLAAEYQAALEAEGGSPTNCPE
jgi:uncharacterized YceG family protein